MDNQAICTIETSTARAPSAALLLQPDAAVIDRHLACVDHRKEQQADVALAVLVSIVQIAWLSIQKLCARTKPHLQPGG